MGDITLQSWTDEAGELHLANWIIKSSGSYAHQCDPLKNEYYKATIGIKTTDGKFGTFVEVPDSVLGTEAETIIKKLLLWIFRRNLEKFPLSESLITQLP